MTHVLINRGESGYWFAEYPSVPGTTSQSGTKEEAAADICETMDAHIGGLQEDNPPCVCGRQC
jgi:predicted RNase H-like HicB family nuclease